MPSTYSPNLRIELIANGEQSGTWGTTTNNNLGTLIEDAISGYVSVSITSANQALTALNGAADQSRNMVLNLTTLTGANFSVYIPPADKVYIIRNASSYDATIYCSTVLGNTTAAGTGVTIPAGKETLVFSDGTNVAFSIDHLSSLTLVTDLAVADGGTGASTASGARTNLGLGTIATQNANNVSITGGSITGITPLAVADGGTGQSSYTNGQLLIGNSTGNTLTKTTLTGTSNQIAVTNGAGSITLSTPQDIDTGADVQFGSISINQPSPAGDFDIVGNMVGNTVSVAALDIDCSAGNYFIKTINGNSTFTFSNIPASRSYGFTLELTINSGQVTWPASVRWPYNIAPTLTEGATTLAVFVTSDGGTYWRGAVLTGYVA